MHNVANTGTNSADYWFEQGLLRNVNVLHVRSPSYLAVLHGSVTFTFVSHSTIFLYEAAFHFQYGTSSLHVSS